MKELKFKKEKISKILLREKTAIVLNYRLDDLLLSLVDDKEYCTVKLAEPYLMPLHQIYNQSNKHLLSKEEIEEFDSDRLYLYQILKVKFPKLRRKKDKKSQKKTSNTRTEKMNQIKQETKEHKTTKKSSSNSAVNVQNKKKHILRVRLKASKTVYMDISKPYLNEHAARVRNPGDFKKDSFRSQTLKKGLRRISGRLKSNNKWETQAYRFHKDYFTVAQAKSWLKSHKIKYILFEPATNGK
ncbi:MAG: hypothetical protein ACFFAU_01365 [Candidatus Hodarchaeota archaeon]